MVGESFDLSWRSCPVVLPERVSKGYTLSHTVPLVAVRGKSLSV